MAIIDAHIHTWRLNDGKRIWIRDKIAALQRDFSMADFEAASAGLGVASAIIVQAAADTGETASLVEEYRHDPRVAGIIGWLDLGAEDIAAHAARYVATDKVCGVRAHPPRQFDMAWLASAKVRRGLRACADAGIPVDFLVNCTQLVELRSILEPLPGLVSVLDHGGRPFVMTGDTATWRRDIGELAKVPGCYCKLSGLAERAGVEWNAETLKPWIGGLLETFGPKRLIFASNWPIMTLMASPTYWLDALHGILDGFGVSADEKAMILSGNARSVYLLGEG